MQTVKFNSVDALFKKEEADKVHIVVDEARLKNEIHRLVSYLRDRSKKDYQIISTMEDLGVIVDTKGLSRVEIMKELEEIACTYRQLRGRVKLS